MTYDFIALDFEIANNYYSSACSLGLVFVKENKIFDSKYFLIKPPTLHFDETNIRVHGITANDVKNSPKFPEVWDQIKHFFNENIIVAHNAIFDMTVLKSCLLEYNLDIPNFYYLCSIPISTYACNGEKIGQSLKDRTEYFGIKIDQHHNALSDAIACAKLVIKCIEAKECDSLMSYYQKCYNLSIKHFYNVKPQKTFGKKTRKQFNRVIISEITPTKNNFDTTHIFYGKNIVFTGELDSMQRKDAMQRVVDLGGILKSSVSRKTDFLIVGKQDKSIVGDDGLSRKEEKAYELIEKGFNIKILNEDEFLKILG